MSKQIDKLTKEQEAMLPKYLERFKAIGLSAGVTDKAKAENAIRRSYEYFHKKDGSCVATPEFVWAESPMKGRILAAQYTKGSEDVTEEEVKAQYSQASYGSFEAFWVSSYAFISEQLIVPKDDICDIVVDIITHCGVHWNFVDLVVLTPKPVEIHLKNDKLHNETGPALLYPNGDCIYALNGELKGSLMEVAIAVRVGDTNKSA